MAEYFCNLEIKVMNDGPHHPIAEAMRVAREEAAVRDHMNAPMGGRSVFSGEGIGALSGWLCFFGMIGAILGGLSSGIVGAIVGAGMFAGGVAVIALVARKTSFVWDRGPAWVWGIIGFVAGALLGASMQSDLLGWGLAGAMLFWGFRAVYRKS